MRVAVTLEQCWHRVPGGTARATLDTVAAVRAGGGVDQVGVSAWHRQPPPDPWRPVVPVRRLPLPRSALYDAWQRLRWPLVERATGGVDLVHATAHVAPASRAPWVATVHDLHFLHEPGHFTARGVSVFTRFLDLVREEAAMVVCPSEATATDCEAAGIERARLRITPWGTDARPVAPGEVDRVRRAYDLGRPYVLFVGTLEPRKNLARLLEAFGRLGDVDADLVIVGPDGWSTELPPTSARKLGFVPQADRDALYAAATAVAYPSLREGFGLPVLEAMVQGAAVVTSATTSTAEVIGEAGLLVDPLDVDAIAAALRRLLDNPDLAARLGAAARQQAATFTWERTATAMTAAYRDSLGRDPMSSTEVGVNLLWLVPGAVGGSEQSTTATLRALRDLGPTDLDLRLFVLEPFVTAHPDLVDAFPTEVLPVSGRSRPVRVAGEATWLAARTRRTDLVHHAGGTAPPVRGGPYVLTVHDLQPLEARATHGRGKRAYLRTVLPRSVRGARAVAVPSEFVRRSVIDRFGLDADRVTAVHHGVAAPPADAASEEEVRARYRLVGPIVLYPAITYPHKNHATLVEAFAAVHDRHPNATLVLPGAPGGCEADLARQVARLGLGDHVRRLGRVPDADVAGLYAAATVAAVPSRYEGFGLPAAEAMAAGVALVAAATTALPEVVGEAGLLVDPDDPAAWADAISRLLGGPAERSRLAAAGLARAERYTWRRNAEAFAALYRAAATTS